MAYLVVGLASLAVLATSQSIPTRVSRIVPYEEKLYMVIAEENGSYLHGIEASINGHDWINVEFDELPPTLQATIQQPPQTLVCEIEKPQNCYRVAKPDQLEGSTDNGQTWQVIWQIPWGRREFMERYRKGQLFGYSRTVDAGPFDLALLELDGQVTLVAAMGNEGILIRNPDKTWERRAEGGGSPTPYTQGNMPFIILNETIVTVLVAIFGLNILSVWLGTNHSVGASLLDDVMPILWALGISIVGLFLWPWLFSGNNPAFFPLLLLIVSPFYIGPMWTWNRIIRSSAQPVLARSIRNLLLCMAVSIFPIAWLPFVAWDQGIIPAYFQAFILAAILGSSGIVWGIWRLRQIYRKAGETASTPTESVINDSETA